MKNFILRYRDKWGIWTAVWWCSFITFIALYANAGIDIADLFAPAIQGSAVGLVLVAIYAYSRSQKTTGNR